LSLEPNASSGIDAERHGEDADVRRAQSHFISNALSLRLGGHLLSASCLHEIGVHQSKGG